MKKLIYWIALFLFLSVHSLFAQIVKPIVKPLGQSNITSSTIQEKIDALKNNVNLEEALKLNILNAYQAAVVDLKELSMIEQEIQLDQDQLQNLPNVIKQLEEHINDIEKQQEEKFSFDASDELKQRLIIDKSSLDILNSSINQIEIQIDEQLEQPQQIRDQVADIKIEQDNIQHEWGNLKTLTLSKQEINASQVQLESRSRRLNATLNKLYLKNTAYPLIQQAQKLELQSLNIQSTHLSALIKRVDDFLRSQRQQEIKKKQALLIQAQKKLTSKHPVIQTIIQESIQNIQLLQETNKKLEQYRNQKKDIDARYKQLDNDFQNAGEKIDLAKLSPSLGNLLHEQRRNLPLTKNMLALFDSIQKENGLARLEQIHLDDEKKSLVDIDQDLHVRMSAYVWDKLGKTEKLKISNELRGLLNNEKELVVELSSVYTEYSRTLADVKYSLQQLVALGEKFNQYLGEHLFWVPSAPAIDRYYGVHIFESIRWLGNILHWQQLVVDIKHSIKINPFLALLGFITFFSQLWFRRAINASLQDLLKKARKPYSDRFVFTFYGLGHIFLLVLPLSLLLALLGWLLQVNTQVENFSHAVGVGLLTAAFSLLILQFLYQTFKPEGLVQSLFGWQEHSIHVVHGQLKWIRLVVIPMVFIIGMFADGVYIEHSYTLARTASIIILLILAYALHRFAHPVKGLGKDLYQENPNSWVYRLRYIWYVMLVLTPLIIIGFAAAGYYQSALELQDKLLILLQLIFFIVLLHEIIMRWLVLTNRQLALQNARQKRKINEQEEAKEETGVTTINLEEEFLLDIPKINEQSKKLLKAVIIAIFVVGCWLTLRDILPAFSIFEKVVLWQHMVFKEGVESQQPITLFNVFFTLLYLVLMLIFVKNFPSLIDLFFVGKYGMTLGSRYAVIQLTRYTIIIITFIAMANELGGKWSEVQWLVAALGVGLGFGLQEIFANMVSGVILLFERPIRIGDTVTVGDKTGKVSRIHIRATTLIDWDHKELVIPNKIFITDQFINWTLTNPVTRVVIPVGIAYGSDEKLALRIFKQVFEETPLILKNPEPTAYFVGFGDSSLNFTLRVYVNEIDNILPVTDEIHQRIKCAFKEHNIEIPFPQRDLHICSPVLDGEIT